MFKKYLHILIYGLILFVPGLVFFASTSPDELPVALYVLPFIYIFACVYLTTRFLMLKLGGGQRYIHLLPNIIAILVTLILLLGSLQQLSGRDVFLILAIGGLFAWYLRKLNPKV